jgi:hypothetical protein
MYTRLENRLKLLNLAPAFWDGRLAMNDSTMCRPLKNCASADWYDAYDDERCPQGSRVESVIISKSSAGEWQERQTLVLTVSLASALGTGKILLIYKGVSSYSLEGFGYDEKSQGLGAWLKDEVGATKNSFLSHDVSLTNGKIRVKAADAEYQWQALKPGISS